jgi:predicted GH43/DUF377 family glycosyl hydrolase
MIKVRRSKTILRSNPNRVIILFNSLGIGGKAKSARAENLMQRVLSLPEEQAIELYTDLSREFSHRHKHLESVFRKYANKVLGLFRPEAQISEKRLLLLGAHFAKEYSIQAAALFNPSIVCHPDQSNLQEGEKRFIMSLRSVGEGHISSIEFRAGVIAADGEVTLDSITPYSSRAEKDPSLQFVKEVVKKRTDIISGFDNHVFDPLPDSFTYANYISADENGVFDKFDLPSQKLLFEFMDTNYDVVSDDKAPLCERVVFPSAQGESMGMEDTRFVEFTHEDGRKEYIGTYTAYNGRKITPQLIMTDDFVHFRVRTMFGSAVSDKGFALFPEKIHGKYVMTARQGGENLTLMESDDLFNWDSYEVIMSPQFSWGLVQQGNCGSPLKTEKGWLLITHAVGPMRKYVISAILLHLDNPRQIIGKLQEPLISPNKSEREGYVPNVVYSCGAMIHHGNVIIPYAMSDSAASFATIALSEIFKSMGV